MTFRWRVTVVSLAGMILVGAGIVNSQLPSVGAGGLLHPARRRVVEAPPTSCREATFPGEGVTLEGWRCRASEDAPGGTVIYLHGIADNRTSGRGAIERFGKRGFEVVAYDSRAHGESEGDACTYGFFEKHDLRRVIDVAHTVPIVLVGTSLGAAVALQEAGEDSRVSAVIAAETFSDLRTIATERAPFFFTSTAIARAFDLAEEQGRFDVDAVSPVRAAAHIAAPVLLIHGEEDVDTSPEHSRRVFRALRGPRRLIVVPGAGHNASLRSDVWDDIDRWLDGALGQRPG